MNLVSKFGSLIIMVIILLTGESPLEVAQRGKHKDIVRMLKEKEDEELNLIAEVEYIYIFSIIFINLKDSHFVANYCQISEPG